MGTRRLRGQVAADLRLGSRVLEVAPGPGYFAIELAKLGQYRVDALDISKTFVEIAARNAKEANVGAPFLLGNASSMPYERESFDFVFCRGAFKNFAQPICALKEIHRVLRQGGKGLLIDLRRDASPEAIRRVVDQMGRTLVNRIFVRLTFRFMLLGRAYTESQFREFFAHTEFRSVEFCPDPVGLEIRFEKEEQVARGRRSSPLRRVATAVRSISAASPEPHFVDPQPFDAKLQRRGRHTKSRGSPFGSSDFAG
jgi:ubiquinone/menaquinone biosynthesis C-methylase UbiE